MVARNLKDIIPGDIREFQNLGENHTELIVHLEEDSEVIQKL